MTPVNLPVLVLILLRNIAHARFRLISSAALSGHACGEERFASEILVRSACVRRGVQAAGADRRSAESSSTETP